MNNIQGGESAALYNSRIIDTYIKLIKRKYSFVNIGELLNYAGMKSYEVADQGHWFSQEQVNRFHEKLQEMTGNKDIAREAGRYASSPDAIGVMRQFFLGLVGPAGAFEMIGKGAANFTRSSTYECRMIDFNRVEITVTPRPGTREKLFQCKNRVGFWEALVLAFTNKLPVIEHSECLFKGGNVCRYIVTWEKTSSAAWKKIRYNAAMGLAGLIVAGGVWNPQWTVAWFLPFSALALLTMTLIVEIKGKKELGASLENLRDSTDRLLEQIDINYNNALMTNEIGQAISRQANMQIEEYAVTHTNIENILQNVVQILEKRLDYERGLILLANTDKTKLEMKVGFGYEDDHRKLLEQAVFNLDRPDSQGAFVVSFREQRPILINDLGEIEDALSPRSQAFARKLGVQSFICCPIVCDGESIGVLAVDNPRSNRPLVNSDMSLLMGIAPMIGVAVRNAELIDIRNRQFKSLLQLLAATIDARDPLTAGHSEKVTEYALGICREMDLPADHREMVRVAALLHDYGKIAVPDAILKKEGRLTAEEYEIVKAHSQRTREILEQISFEGIFKQVPEVAGAHHEKMDGSGYPRGLKGEEIPLGARIIAVADFFEAITSRRHYREPMSLGEAFKLLQEGSGVHFDEKVLKAFIWYFLKAHPEGLPSGLRADGIYIASEKEIEERSRQTIYSDMSEPARRKIKGQVVWLNDHKSRR